jgi:hypothetical protein
VLENETFKAKPATAINSGSTGGGPDGSGAS